jgi:hypothetical protein
VRILAAVALGLAVAAAASASSSAPRANCERTSTSFVPLTELGQRKYLGFAGGLYSNGRNKPSATTLKRAMAHARAVGPLARDGSPAAGGRIVLLSIGMSNTTQEFRVFKQRADADPVKSPRVAIVDGAQGGQDAEEIKDPGSNFWGIVDARLSRAGVTGDQVQVVWLKQAIARPTEPFPAHAQRLQQDLDAIWGILRSRFPHVRIVYASSRTYAGYATTSLNPEPYAYESGFAVKWFVRDRITSRAAGPWVAWGPYLWTNGTKGRRDGLRWICADVRDDGTHPSASGAEKVAGLLLRFFKTEPTARRWFVR